MGVGCEVVDVTAPETYLHWPKSQRLKQILLQTTGMYIIDHKESRDALNLNADQVAKLKATHRQLITDISGGGKAKLSPTEVKKQGAALLKGVPDKVRAALSDQQRKKLQELMGLNQR
jgi:hypothetical protein